MIDSGNPVDPAPEQPEQAVNPPEVKKQEEIEVEETTPAGAKTAADEFIASDAEPAGEEVEAIAETEEEPAAESQSEEAPSVEAESGEAVSGEASSEEEPKPVVPQRGPDEPLELIEEEEEEIVKNYYILKVSVNRENTVCDALRRKVKMEGMEDYFGDIIVPTEEVVEFTKAGKKKIVKRKLYPGYIVVHMAINDDSWFLVRETAGIGDFTGAGGKPAPMSAEDVAKIVKKSKEEKDGETPMKTSIKFKVSDRVRVKDGYFQNFEGDVDSIDEANGRVTVIINIFNRSTPVELEHWQIESV